MANCNNKSTTLDPDVLKNAILEYKRDRNAVNDQSLKPFLKIIDYIENQISAVEASSSTQQSLIVKQFCGTTWTVEHGLNTRYVIAQTYDNEYNQLIPKSIELIDENTVVITFLLDVCGYVVISGAGTSTITGGTNGSNGTSGINGSNGTSGIDGVTGPRGTDGTSGETGIGVPPGGTSGQVLAKVSDEDYDTEWITLSQPAPSPDSSGTSGSDGTKGQDGTSGTDGPSGTHGTSGSSGKTGNAGTSGTSGKTGTSGIDGMDAPNSARWIYFGVAPDQDPYGTYFTTDYAEIDLLRRLTISTYDINQTNLYDWLISIKNFLATNPILLQIIEVGDSSVLGIFTVDSIIDNFVYFTIELSPFTTNGVLSANKKYAISWILSGESGTSGTSSDSFTFTEDLSVSISSSKSFGRYVNGDTIPATGKTVAEVIELAIKEPIFPTVNLTSSTSILFNQIAIENRLLSSYTINSFGASVDTAVLEWRRNNNGDWTVLSTTTANPNPFTHSLTDTNFNTSSFNYRYIVTDTEGASKTAYLNLSPSTYLTASANLNVIGTSISLPETNRKRERGNVSTTLSGVISKNSNFVSMSSYTVQFRVNEGNWFGVPGLTNIAMSGNTVTIPSTIHVPTGSANITDVDYQIQVVDTYSTSSLSYKSINFFYIFFYGPSASRPITSSMVRSLNNRLFMDYTGSFNLYTGGAYSIFTVAMPSTFNLSEVIDLDAGYTNLTTNYSQSNFNVMDSGSNATPYHIYTLSNSIAYTDYNHRHRISTTGLLWYTPTITTLDYTE